MSSVSLVVVGEMNIDVIVSGLPHFPKAGQLVNGKQLSFGAGGKSRNIAAMASALMPKGSVAMVSKTVRDDYGLWEIPVNALDKEGVDTKYIKVIAREKTDKLPGFAIILVDNNGNNQIIGAPGITRELSTSDIDEADSLFQEVGANNGFVAFIGNCPSDLAKYISRKTTNLGAKVLFDPGGADDLNSLFGLLDENIFLFKPNEHEAEVLTGVKVIDLKSAKKAATKLMSRGVKNVMITAGSKGAFLLCPEAERHIPIPQIELGPAQDETGCGDQVMAALCAFMGEGKDIQVASRLAIIAGTLQFHRAGIRPVRSKEIAPYLGSAS